MKIRNTIIIFLCLLMTSCMSKISQLETESKAKDYMERAAALEKTEAYHHHPISYDLICKMFLTDLMSCNSDGEKLRNRSFKLVF